ncbi:MAG: helix-turn-helix domain-containing protein [Candidatus Paceibacterota bacterium]|jgi:transcriptional regulator with XRE-family HTH domain
MKTTFGELLGAARRKRGITLRQIKEVFGGVPSYWSEIETGRRLPPKDNGLLRKIAKFLGIDEEVFVRAAQTDRIKKDTSVMEKLYNTDPELAWGLFRAMEDTKNENLLKDEFHKIIAALNKQGESNG